MRGAAGNPSDVPNLVFVPAYPRALDLSSCGQSVAAPVGAIDVFDMTDADGNFDPYLFTIRPPGNPASSEQAPCSVAGFGRWSDTGDVNGDGIDDLLVSAIGADDGQGRIYIFFGHEHFHLDPAPGTAAPGWLKQWAILFPPPNPPASDPFFANGGFGHSMSAADLDGDGFAEVCVGRPEKGRGPGRVHLFHGDWIQGIVGHHAFREVRPSAPASIDAGVPGEYETLIDDDVVRPIVSTAAFGWIVSIKGGDLGRLGTQGFDELPDVLVHSEGAGGYAADGTTLVDAGALFVYYGDSVTTTGSLVDESAPVKLMTPRINVPGGPVYAPTVPGRFGRGFAVVNWQKLDGSPVRVLLAGEPNRAFPDPQDPEEMIEGAGAVYAFQLPLPPSFDPHATGVPHLNAWGDDVLLEPDDSVAENVAAQLDIPGAMSPQPTSVWGAWIVGGVYDSDLPSDQVGICARERSVGTLPRVGRVYALSLAPTAP